jgi:hypothetical protein
MEKGRETGKSGANRKAQNAPESNKKPYRVTLLNIGLADLVSS